MQENNLLELIQKCTQNYINDKKSQNLSINTINTYILVLESFYEFCADELDENPNLTLKDINKYFLNNYLQHLQKKGLNAVSQKCHLTVLKNYFCFIADSDIKLYGYLKLNINGVKIKVEQKEKPSFTQDEQKRIADYISQLDQQKNYLAHRNSLLLKILLYTGVRISELINIKWSDIEEYCDEEHGDLLCILINGKGNKQRYTYLKKSEIEDNLEFIRNKKTAKDYLFTTSQGNPCNRSNLFKAVGNLLEKAGVGKSGLHIFRHTFARNLVRKDHNLSTIKELLGHANITITAQFYAKSDENAKINALFSKK